MNCLQAAPDEPCWELVWSGQIVVGISQMFEQAILEWRQAKENELRSDDGWLTVVGLHWLHEGENTVGSAADADVRLPDSVADQFGVINVQRDQARFRLLDGQKAQIDGLPQPDAPMRFDNDTQGPTRVICGSVTFFIIQRGERLGVRVRDRDNDARQNFEGRRWFPVNQAYRFDAVFTPYPEPRTITIVNIVGIETPMQNVGYLTFDWQGQAFRLEALKSNPGLLWLIFKDATSGKSSYGGGRFLMASVQPNNEVDLDFNRAYHPPCAFTAYATCPIPPKENVLTIPIEAGERL